MIELVGIKNVSFSPAVVRRPNYPYTPCTPDNNPTEIIIKISAVGQLHETPPTTPIPHPLHLYSTHYTFTPPTTPRPHPLYPDLTQYTQTSPSTHRPHPVHTDPTHYTQTPLSTHTHPEDKGLQHVALPGGGKQQHSRLGAVLVPVHTEALALY